MNNDQSVLETADEKHSRRDLADQNLLADIGYKQELKRNFTLLSMIGFSFSILACWTALAGALSETMLNGGPAGLFYGWFFTCSFTLFVVLSLADICSAYPVSGGQYSWCILLARDRFWGRGVSYVCGWIQLAGLVCMGSTALYQFALIASGMGVLNSPGFAWVPDKWKVVLIAWTEGVLILLIDVFGSKILRYVSSLALYWSIGGFIVCTITLFACAPKLQSAKFVFTTVIEGSGWNNRGMALILGSIQSAYTISCYDAPAHMAEELQDASREAPRAMISAVLIGAITGAVFILALLFSIQDLEKVINTPTNFPLLEIFYQATNSIPGSICLGCIVVLCQFFGGLSLCSEGSRSIYAFARDGAFPWKLNDWMMSVSDTLDVPVVALIVCMVFQCIFVSILFGSDTAFFTVISIASTGIFVSYLIPIVVYMLCPNNKARGYYNLGKWTLWVHIPAVLYLIFCIIFFFFPTTLPVTGNNMNYCIVAFGVCGIFGLVSWFGGARHTYIKSLESFEGLEIGDSSRSEFKSGKD